MNDSLEAFLVAFGAFLAGSGGFWVYLTGKYERRDKRREALLELLMGLAHDKIVTLGMKHIEKGFITKDEYDDLIKYFWEPYSSLGGDGSAERIVNIVKMLPLKPELRRDPEYRQLQESLYEGTERAIKQLEKGDTNFERQ